MVSRDDGAPPNTVETWLFKYDVVAFSAACADTVVMELDVALIALCIALADV